MQTRTLYAVAVETANSTTPAYFMWYFGYDVARLHYTRYVESYLEKTVASPTITLFSVEVPVDSTAECKSKCVREAHKTGNVNLIASITVKTSNVNLIAKTPIAKFAFDLETKDAV